MLIIMKDPDSTAKKTYTTPAPQQELETERGEEAIPSTTHSIFATQGKSKVQLQKSVISAFPVSPEDFFKSKSSCYHPVFKLRAKQLLS